MRRGEGKKYPSMPVMSKVIEFVMNRRPESGQTSDEPYEAVEDGCFERCHVYTFVKGPSGIIIKLYHF
jgi:hypothetical protein